MIERSTTALIFSLALMTTLLMAVISYYINEQYAIEKESNSAASLFVLLANLWYPMDCNSYIFNEALRGGIFEGPSCHNNVIRLAYIPSTSRRTPTTILKR